MMKFNQLKPRYTAIRQIVDVGDGFIVREDSYKYPQEKSNLYKVGYDFKPIWDAEFHTYPVGADHYCNDVFSREQPGIVACAAKFDDYLISVETGKILDCQRGK